MEIDFSKVVGTMIMGLLHSSLTAAPCITG